MRSAKSFLWVLFLPFLFLNTAFAQTGDTADETPEITARVARISFQQGAAQIKRGDSQDWERANLNLPLVEGDVVATGANARLEIQFSRDCFLRLAENSYLKITTLRDAGIAVSLSEGTASVRALSFSPDKEFFEIDAPQTTIALQKAGMYRIDAGRADAKELRVTVTANGEARVYSADSGFAVRNGRSAKIRLDDNNAGENEISEASTYADEWDSFVLNRDNAISQSLKQTSNDKYYDREMYGAEDLSNYGEWINTKKYGYVWRPSGNAVASYTDWSPYRYGEWRWLPPYGWTWVNDEPWGWATYHYGRWIYEDGYWAWTPYPYNRPKRNWWNPALVIVVNIDNDICWYPLPYDRRARNYNSRNHDDRRDHRRDDDHRDKFERNVPPNGVARVRRDEFGNGRRWIGRAPDEIARRVLAREPSQTDDPTLLVENNTRHKRPEVSVDNFPRQNELPVRVGAGDRRPGIPLDGELRRERVRGNRLPATGQQPNSNENQNTPATGNEENTGRRRTGAVERPSRPDRRSENSANNAAGPQPPTSQLPVTPPANNNSGADENRRGRRNQPAPDANNEVEPPQQNRRNRSEAPKEERQPRNNPPPTTTPPPSEAQPEERRRERQQPPPAERPDSPGQREEPKREEPPRREESPKREEPKREEPKREEPKREEPKREEPKREEPKREERKREEPKPEEPKQEKPRENNTPKTELPDSSEPNKVNKAR